MIGEKLLKKVTAYFGGSTPKQSQPISDSLALMRQNKPFEAHSNTGNFGLISSTTRSGGKSARGLSRYESVLIKDHWALRQNTRVVVDTSTQARAILNRSKDTVVGNGLKPDPRPAFNILGITREAAKEWAENWAEILNLWALSKDSDLTGHNNFYQNQALIKWFLDRDGEFFIRLTYSDDPNLINPVQISFIDPNQIRGDEFTTSFGPTVQDDGIIKDDNGKPTAYKVWMTDNKKIGHFRNVVIPAFDEKTGRPVMIHGFKREWAGQTRGIPEISHSLQEYEDITSFDAATTKKRTIESTLGLIVENEQQDPGDLGLASINNQEGAGLVTTEKSAPTPAPTNLGVNGVTSCVMDEATFTESGSVVVLGAQQGDKLKAIPAATPAEKTGEFVDYKMGYLAPAFGMPVTIAKMQMGKAHSASRAELGMYADIIAIKISDLAADALNTIAGAVLSEEIAAGRVQAPGFSDPILKAAWSNMNWIGNPLPDVDPLKTKQGIKLDLELGLTDFDTEAQKLNGSSGEANRLKLAKQLDELPTDPFELRELEENTDHNDDETEDDED